MAEYPAFTIEKMAQIRVRVVFLVRRASEVEVVEWAVEVAPTILNWPAECMVAAWMGWQELDVGQLLDLLEVGRLRGFYIFRP
jgi:hypothetical protein